MYVASASTTLKLHEFPSGDAVHNYQPGTKVDGPIRSVSWSRDGNWLVIVPHFGPPEILTVKSNLKLLKFIPNVEEPTCAAFLSSKKTLGISTKNGLVMLYDVKSRIVKKRFPRCISQITHLEFSTKDTHCAAACKNGDVCVFNTVTNSPPSILKVPKSTSVSCMKINSLKHNLMCGGSNEGVVTVWDSNVGKPKWFREAFSAPVNAVTFSTINQDLIASAGGDRQFLFFDYNERKQVASVTVDNNITSLDYSQDGMHVIAGSQNGRVFIYDCRNISEPVHSFQAHKATVRHLAFQKRCEKVNSGSMSSLLSDVVSPVLPAESQKKTHRTSDLFGLAPAGSGSVSMTDIANRRTLSKDEGDSFLLALGIEEGNSATSHNDSVFSKHSASKLPALLCTNPGGDNIPTPNSAKLFEPKQILSDMQFSSTPKVCPGSGSGDKTVEIKSILESMDIKSTLREIFKEELDKHMEEAKKIVELSGMHTIHELRRNLFDIQMLQVKQFVYMEKVFEAMKHATPFLAAGCDMNSLVEENEQLKVMNKFLEEQLKNAMMTKDNGSEIL
ncbi:unnamed protein product [Callosobruchus maculatus]|uniref:Anaphase-promoting complex subunit 4-like WD40 domain-containing protein n=1 Tax=Callosobruchus maculatus TaxID=64391 RepID=A0A653C6V4_CALMS|nr:unnamed protein product [Callosobruchus maculatus]